MSDELKLHILFNKKTRQLTSLLFDLDTIPEAIRSNFLIKTIPFSELGIPDEEINLTRYKWIGDYDTGRLVDIFKEKKAVVSEKDIDDKYDSMFFSRYELRDILYELILSADMSNRTLGREMQEYLSKIVKKKQDDMEFFKNSPIHIWESREVTNKRQKEAFAT